MRTAKGFHSGGRKQTTSTAGDFKRVHARASTREKKTPASPFDQMLQSSLQFHTFLHISCVTGLEGPGRPDSLTINVTFTVIRINLTISALDSTGLIRSRVHKQG